jgi:hypothetical protein
MTIASHSALLFEVMGDTSRKGRGKRFPSNLLREPSSRCPERHLRSAPVGQMIDRPPAQGLFRLAASGVLAKLPTIGLAQSRREIELGITLLNTPKLVPFHTRQGTFGSLISVPRKAWPPRLGTEPVHFPSSGRRIAERNLLQVWQRDYYFRSFLCIRR